MGKIMVVITTGIIKVAAYNGFNDATAVQVGWMLLRDIANMVFVVALLMMAFGTMLDIEALGNTQHLAKLVIMAVAVNFSKTLTLFMIDIGQVVMLTFVAAFQSTAAGNFIKAFGIEEWLKLTGDTAEDVAVTVIVGMILAAILATVATGVLIVFLGFLLARVAMLWILIIFSPLVFGLSVLGHKGHEYYAKWWKELSANIIAGPLLAFFLWLTLLVAGSSMGGSLGNEILLGGTIQSQSPELPQAGIQSPVQSAAFAPDVLITFIVSTMMLLLGLKITQEVGEGAAMSVATGIKGKAAGLAKWGLKKAVKGGWWATKKGGKFLGNIPLGVGKPSLAGLAVGTGAAIAGSNIGKALGLNKEHTERARAERKARVYRALGQETEARALEQAVIAQQRKKLEPLTQAQLEKNLKEMRQKGDTTSLAYQSVALELANKGYFTDKPHGSVDAVAKGMVDKGDAAFKKDLIAVVNTKGGNYKAFEVDPDKAVADMVKEAASKSVNELRKLFSDIDKGMQIGADIDGNEAVVDPHATRKLSALDSSMYGKLTDQGKEKVQNALLLGMKNAKSDSDRGGLMNKFNALTGAGMGYDPVAQDFVFPAGTTHREQMNKLFNDQSKTLAESKAKQFRTKAGAVSDIDVALSASMREGRMSNADKQTVQQTLLPTVLSVDERLQGSAAPGKFNDERTEVARIQSELRSTFRRLIGPTGRKDEAGNDMSYEQVFDASTLNQALQKMQDALRQRQGAVAGSSEATKLDALIVSIQKEIGAAAQELSAGGRSKTAGARGKYDRIIERMKNVDAQVKSKVQSAKSSTNAAEKLRQLRSASEQMLVTVQQLHGKEINLDAALRNSLHALEQDLEKLENDVRNSGINPYTMGSLENVARRFEDLRKKIK